jgi:energy-coupling factor transport system permease protein
MLIAWKYKERNTAYQRLNPRVRLVFILALLFAIIQIWDLRVLVGFFAVALVQYIAARLTWQETRVPLLFTGGFIGFITLLTFLTGQGGLNIFQDTTILWQGKLGWYTLVVSSERLAFTAAQALRLVTMALLVIVFPYTIHPARYGVIFKGLGASDKVAVATDLAFRFVPSLGNDFATTMEAQRARGYELERAGGLIKAIRNLAPLLVPVTIGAILKGEELIDAMDLRAFGSGPRTWSQVLIMRPPDYLLLALGMGTFVGVTLLNLLVPTFGLLWVPGFLRGSW